MVAGAEAAEPADVARSAPSGRRRSPSPGTRARRRAAGARRRPGRCPARSSRSWAARARPRPGTGCSCRRRSGPARRRSTPAGIVDASDRCSASLRSKRTLSRCAESAARRAHGRRRRRAGARSARTRRGSSTSWAETRWPRRPGEAADRALQAGVLEGADPPAAVADDVMVVLAARDHRLIAGPALADLDPLHEPEAVQEVERAVDAGGPDPLAVCPDPLGDLLRGDAAVLARESLDHRAPGAAAATARLSERLERQLGPACLRRSRPSTEKIQPP